MIYKYYVSKQNTTKLIYTIIGVVTWTNIKDNVETHEEKQKY
jgi:hypothetical protein